MTVAPGSEQHADQVMHAEVSHQGELVGIVRKIRRNVENGRRYALIQPVDPADPERRLPLDELKLFGEK